MSSISFHRKNELMQPMLNPPISTVPLLHDSDDSEERSISATAQIVIHELNAPKPSELPRVTLSKRYQERKEAIDAAIAAFEAGEPLSPFNELQFDKDLPTPPRSMLQMSFNTLNIDLFNFYYRLTRCPLEEISTVYFENIQNAISLGCQKRIERYPQFILDILEHNLQIQVYPLIKTLLLGASDGAESEIRNAVLNTLKAIIGAYQVDAKMILSGLSRDELNSLNKPLASDIGISAEEIKLAKSKAPRRGSSGHKRCELL